MRHSLLITLSFITLLSACTVGPDFKSPDTPPSNTYTSSEDSESKDQHIALGQELAKEWWTLFASAPLNDAIAQGIANNYDIASARETLAQAQEAVNAAQGALFPQLSLTGTAGKQKYGVALFGPTDFKIPPFAYYEAGPAISWTPDIFGGTRRTIERQKALADYQQHELDAAYVALTGNIVTQSLTIAATKAEIAATNEIIADDEKTCKLVQASFQAGSNTQIDVLSARTQLESDQALLPPLGQRLNVARHALSILMGKAPADITPPDFDLNHFTLPKTLPVSLPSELVHKRPDILAAEAQLHSASAAIGVATANLYPSFSLNANTLQEALTPHGLFESTNNAWSLAGGLTAPIFNGGTLIAQKREAEHAYQAMLAQYKQTILLAFGQVADTLTALAHDSELVAAQLKTMDTAGASLKIARQSYQAGNTGLLQIQDAQRQLAQAKIGLIRAQSQRYLDTAQLFVSVGGSPFVPKP